MSEQKKDYTKVHLNGLAWIPKNVLSELQAETLRRDTTVRLKAGPYDDGPTNVEMFREEDFFIGIPRGFFFKTSSGSLPVEVDVTTTHRDLVAGVGARDELQEEGIETISGILSSSEVAGVIMCAATGVGKTVMGLIIAAQLKMTTVVLVHKTSLMRQWKERIESDPGVLPDARVGIFQGDTEEFGDDYDVVIAMVQTLANRPPDHPFFSWAGMLIADECHRMAAPTFNDVIHNFSAAKRLGLTATPRRRDGGEQLFFDAIGPIGWVGSKPMLTPKVRKIDTGLTFSKDYPSWVEQKIIARNLSRNNLIIHELKMARKKGRQVLILTKRLSQLLILKKIAEREIEGTSLGVCTGSWYVDEDDAYKYCTDYFNYQNHFASSSGDHLDRSKIDESIHDVGDKNKVTPKKKRLKPEQFDTGKHADVIFATYQAVEEGFDVKRLDTLFLASPIWDCEQATGRILRKDEEKSEPIVVHFVDSKIPKFKKAWEICRKKYRDLGAPI